MDKVTGAATEIGVIGGSASNIGALDFDPTTGVLYGGSSLSTTLGRLWTIDLLTGQGTHVAASHPMNGIAFDFEGTLYATFNGGAAGIPTSLIKIDKQNGEWELIGTTDADNILGIDFNGDPPPPDVPATDATGAVLLMLAMLGPGAYFLRRRASN